ncbi:MAG: hypothetical protein JJE39_10200 [Vicinamibacteria bacterium]|nr:hypothetical protein [Vicinamibacteria bacterium]
MPTSKKVVRRTTAKGGARARRTRASAPLLQRPAEVERWIQKEVQQQERIYRNIVREMNALNDRRIKWVKEFYQRIQTRGFSVHAGLRRKVAADEIPRVPKRIRVVF